MGAFRFRHLASTVHAVCEDLPKHAHLLQTGSAHQPFFINGHFLLRTFLHPPQFENKFHQKRAREDRIKEIQYVYNKIGFIIDSNTDTSTTVDSSLRNKSRLVSSTERNCFTVTFDVGD